MLLSVQNLCWKLSRWPKSSRSLLHTSSLQSAVTVRQYTCLMQQSKATHTSLGFRLRFFLSNHRPNEGAAPHLLCISIFDITAESKQHWKQIYNPRYRYHIINRGHNPKSTVGRCKFPVPVQGCWKCAVKFSWANPNRCSGSGGMARVVRRQEGDILWQWGAGQQAGLWAGRQGVEGTRTWYLCWILAPFPRCPWQPQDVQICTTFEVALIRQFTDPIAHQADKPFGLGCLLRLQKQKHCWGWSSWLVNCIQIGELKLAWTARYVQHMKPNAQFLALCPI